MIFLSSIIFILIFSSISLSSSLLYTTRTNENGLPTRYLNHSSIINFLDLNYYSFATDVDALSRTCSIKLLTNASMIAAVQQNVHAILELLFGDYHLAKHSLEDIEMYRNERLKA